MKKSPVLLAALLAAQVAFGQLSSRSVSSKPALPAYDSSININKIDCQFDPASLIGQEIYFAPRIQYGREHWEDSTFRVFTTENHKPYKGKNGLTPYSALENKTFKIVNYEQEGDACFRQVTLQDENGEKIYWEIATRWRLYVAVFLKGYLEKLKQTWLNKNVYFRTDPNDIPYDYVNPLDKQTKEFVAGSKWKCTDLTLIEEEDYFGHLALILEDSAKKEIAVRITHGGNKNPDDKYLTQRNIWNEEKYLAVKKKEKHERDSVLAAQKAERIQAEKERKAMRAQFIKDYGATNGALIADGKVKLGFTTDMCLLSWGYPEHKMQAAGTGGETWLYGWGSWLRFRNDKLVFIME
jgi:hypothetical protein